MSTARQIGFDVLEILIGHRNQFPGSFFLARTPIIEISGEQNLRRMVSLPNKGVGGTGVCRTQGIGTGLHANEAVAIGATALYGIFTGLEEIVDGLGVLSFAEQAQLGFGWVANDFRFGRASAEKGEEIHTEKHGVSK